MLGELSAGFFWFDKVFRYDPGVVVGVVAVTDAVIARLPREVVVVLARNPGVRRVLKQTALEMDTRLRNFVH